jgi:hypothetical protein
MASVAAARPSTRSCRSSPSPGELHRRAGGTASGAAMGAIAVAGFIAVGFIAQDASVLNPAAVCVIVPSWLWRSGLNSARRGGRPGGRGRSVSCARPRLACVAVEERRAMARELTCRTRRERHAHQSGAARQVFWTAPDRAEERAHRRGDRSRAMAELRRMLGVLNDEGGRPTRPQPGVDRSRRSSKGPRAGAGRVDHRRITATCPPASM